MIDQTLFQTRTAAFFTLGCKLNFSETSTIARSMEEEGFKRVKSSDKADVYVINTCSVTETADKKCRQIIKKALSLNSNAFIVVTGCFAQLKPEAIVQMPGVDLVLGTNEKFDIVSYLGSLEKKQNGEISAGKIKDVNNFQPSYSSGDRTRTFLKIQDGCDYYCSYCTIPLARGKSRNNTILNTVNLAREAASNGAKEIILTGVNIGDFGKSTNESFLDLIKELDEIETISRFRISSIEPNLLTDEIIEFVANSKRFMPHFHIPLQSGCDDVLKLMKRKYDTQLFAKRVEVINRLMPHAFIGVDVIVGLHGETEDFFNTTQNFLQQLEISQLHVFTYSERPNTKALSIDFKVPGAERKRRSEVLHQLSDEKKAAFYRRFEGRKAKVLFEGMEHKGKMNGFTDNYIKVEASFDNSFVNKIIPVELLNYNNVSDAMNAQPVKISIGL